MADLYHTLVRPVVTEKSSSQYGALKEYAFEVHPEATKPEIRAAIQQLFGVQVVQVRTLIQRAKRRTRGKSVGRRPAWKKAFVRLKEGDSIPVFEG
jgi:large subunit ribosomal protein L23